MLVYPRSQARHSTRCGEEKTQTRRFVLRRRNRHLLWSAAGVLIGLGAPAAFAQTVQLSIAYSPTSGDGGYWCAYAACDSGTDNIGLASFAIDVIGLRGVVVTGSYNDTPVEYTGAYDFGFKEFPSNGVGGVDNQGGSISTTEPGNGIAITGGQNVAYGNSHIAADDLEVIQGFGKFAGSFDFEKWSFPALLADGTYSGSRVALWITPDLSAGLGIQTLNQVSGGQWVGPGNISTDTVISGSVVVVAVPEPASAGLLALSGIGLLRRRRRKVGKY
jgi:hypothetical protein